MGRTVTGDSAFSGASLEREPERFRFALELVSVEMFDLETGLLDAVGDTPSEVTATGKPLVQRFQTFLQRAIFGSGA